MAKNVVNRGDTYYLRAMKQRKRYFRSLGTSDKSTAKIRAHDLLKLISKERCDIVEATKARRTRPTIGELFPVSRQAAVARDLRNRTIRGCKMCLKKIVSTVTGHDNVASPSMEVLTFELIDKHVQICIRPSTGFPVWRSVRHGPSSLCISKACGNCEEAIESGCWSYYAIHETTKKRSERTVSKQEETVRIPDAHKLSRERVEERIGTHLQCERGETRRLALDVLAQCVLGKIRQPEGTLKRRWLQAGTGDAFYGQWIWDTMFIVDLLAVFPDQRDCIRDVFQNYWDFQERWNAQRPNHAHDMVPCMIEPRNTTTWLDYPAYSQIPILAWGLERVYQRNGDKELLRQCLAQMERFHEWYWRERDVTKTGLVAVGSYSADIQHARYETFDFECNLDDLKLTPHPSRKGAGEGNFYGDICLPGMTSYLIMSERSLARLAIVMGDSAMAARRKQRADVAAQAMRQHMWDEQRGIFLAVHRDTLEKVPVATIGSWMPLMAEVPTEQMAARMAGLIMTDAWQTPLPVPTCDRTDKRWVQDSYWRGDVWPPTNYLIATGFAHYGYHQIAADIADKCIANAIKNGISEHYDSVTGAAIGTPDLGMSCTLLTMSLDGLSRQYTAKLT